MTTERTNGCSEAIEAGGTLISSLARAASAADEVTMAIGALEAENAELRSRLEAYEDALHAVGASVPGPSIDEQAADAWAAGADYPTVQRLAGQAAYSAAMAIEEADEEHAERVSEVLRRFAQRQWASARKAEQAA